MSKRTTGFLPPVDEDLDDIIEELEDDTDEESTPDDKAIEKKYDEGQGRIVIQRNDFLVPNLMKMFEDRQVLDMTPSYQRRSRWDDKRRSLLVESLLMNIPIPPIFLYEHAYAQYEVMDGQQRLTAIRSFRNNEFKLRGLKLWKELNGRDYRDLPPKIKKGLDRRSIAAVIILTESGKDPKESMQLRQSVFERLNTGGQRLNNQEIRNCLYEGKFNKMLIDAARSVLFTTAWDIPPKESGEPHQVSRRLEKNPLYSTMADVEIVLRYFALRDMTKYKSGMKKTLDHCMIDNQPLSETACRTLEREYKQVLTLATEIYGQYLFRLPKNGSGLTGRRSVPLADAVLLATRTHLNDAEKLKENSRAIIQATEAKLADATTRNTLVGHGNTKRDVEARIALMSGIFSAAAE